MYTAKKQNLFATTFDVITSVQSMALEYVNVNVNIHVTALLERTFYYIIIDAGGSDRRKSLYDKIQDVCENTYGVKSHQIGIFPDERAIIACTAYKLGTRVCQDESGWLN